MASSNLNRPPSSLRWALQPPRSKPSVPPGSSITPSTVMNSVTTILPICVLLRSSSGTAAAHPSGRRGGRVVDGFDVGIRSRLLPLATWVLAWVSTGPPHEVHTRPRGGLARRSAGRGQSASQCAWSAPAHRDGWARRPADQRAGARHGGADRFAAGLSGDARHWVVSSVQSHHTDGNARLA